MCEHFVSVGGLGSCTPKQQRKTSFRIFSCILKEKKIQFCIPRVWDNFGCLIFLKLEVNLNYVFFSFNVSFASGHLFSSIKLIGYFLPSLKLSDIAIIVFSGDCLKDKLEKNYCTTLYNINLTLV